MGPFIKLEEVGQRIRKLRLERRMTLKQVEETSGLSATHLSEIERGRTSPTIGALIKVARSLKRDPSYFIEPEERSDVAHVTRDAPALGGTPQGVRAHALTSGIPGSGIFVYRLTFDAIPDAEFKLDHSDAPGDALYFVRRGSVAASMGVERVRLEAGDAAHASFGVPHRLRGADAEVIAVLTRPLEETLPA